MYDCERFKEEEGHNLTNEVQVLQGSIFVKTSKDNLYLAKSVIFLCNAHCASPLVRPLNNHGALTHTRSQNTAKDVKIIHVFEMIGIAIITAKIRNNVFVISYCDRF